VAARAASAWRREGRGARWDMRVSGRNQAGTRFSVQLKE
jgi:hypothetical protein